MTTEDSGLQEAAAEAYSSRDWPEDFGDENGRYLTKCKSCGEMFEGHKRRVICKRCSSPSPALDAGRVAAEDHHRDCECDLCVFPPISPSPAAVTGEWTPFDCGDATWGIEAVKFKLEMTTDDYQMVCDLCDVHNSEVAQLTARSEAAEAKLRLYEN